VDTGFPKKIMRPRGWAVSSAEEHFLDMEGVRGSIPLPPTMKFNGLDHFSQMAGKPWQAFSWQLPVRPIPLAVVFIA
jgi:hypothetical protein